MGSLAWRVLSYVPGTEPYRVYHHTIRWVDDAIRVIREVFGDDVPDFPVVDRSAFACVTTTEALLPFLHGGLVLANAAESDTPPDVVARDVQAVIDEHTPAWYTEKERHGE